MRLVDLDPRWIMRDGERIGFTFVSPTDSKCRQSCFIDPPKISEQVDLFDALHGEDAIVQPCRHGAHWQIAGGIAAATFDCMTVTPSLDGGPGGLWHGHITNGEILGGI